MNKAFRNLEIYELSKKLVLACYELTADLPPEEKTNFSRYIRAAALDAYLHIAQGIFLRSGKRKKFLKNARQSFIIIDAALEILIEVGYTTPEKADPVLKLCSTCYRYIEDQKKKND